MYIGQIARRYALALAEFAAANGEEELLFDEVRRLIGLYASTPALREVLDAPVLPAATKLDAVRRLAGGRLCASLDAFLALVLRHGREQLLLFMLHSFRGIYKERHGIRDAVLATAAPVGTELVERIRRRASERTGSDVRLRAEIRPELLGGFLFRMDDLLIDASIASQLDTLRRKLGSNPNRIV